MSVDQQVLSEVLRYGRWMDEKYATLNRRFHEVIRENDQLKRKLRQVRDITAVRDKQLFEKHDLPTGYDGSCTMEARPDDDPENQKAEAYMHDDETGPHEDRG